MTSVAILWHMHQPFYEDLATHEHILPWVRLHALKDYYGMVALLEEFPGVKITFNLVPSLLVQLEAFAEGRARDRYLTLSLKPAAELDDSDVGFILDNFFHAQRQRMIDIYPRYAELLARRGGSLPTEADKRAAARRFTADDLRDLQVWHKLAWIDPFYLDADPRIRGLVTKGSRYSEEDKLLLRQVELEILNRVVAAYRAAAERGQIEIATSPFYHPILPLLCDSDVYLRTHPDSPMPRQRFVHPEDAAEQLSRAVACHQRLFGRRPTGLWPSEGSVSDAVAALAARAGFTWMATDELILARTLGVAFTRDGSGQLDHPERLYAPYRLTAGPGSIACAFRDHELSDLIGFHYAAWDADAAAADFVGRLADAGRRYRDRTGGEEAFLPIILDGENAWEHFDGGGRPFLRALYRRLSEHPELRTVTMAEGCAAPRHALTTIFPGSWIDANFYIWIGHADDRRAWSQLADARQTLDEARREQAAGGTTGINLEALADAHEEILIAEGSDWCWWYGDDHSSDQDLEFDDLFRRHLRNVYRALQKAVPDELFVSNISGVGAPPAQTAPTALIAPTLDGQETSYFEWLGAGALEIRDLGGAMHQAERQTSALTLIQFGFSADRERLYIRVDAERCSVAELLGDGYALAFKFLAPAGVRYIVRLAHGVVVGAFWDRAGGNGWHDEGARGAAAVAGQILEVAIPIGDLGARVGDMVAFFVGVLAADGSEVETHPTHHPIEVLVPDELFEARHWTA
jgi:alpha-amylase/alpha-mannosidase (GH57 family)